MEDLKVKKNKRTLPSITWDYETSVQKMKSQVLTWKNISIETLNELHTAKNNLTSQGARNDLYNSNLKGWGHYLNQVGLNKETARRWLKQYNPKKNIIQQKEKEVLFQITTKHKCPNCNYEW